MAGLLFLVPGDMPKRRRLIVSMTLLAVWHSDHCRSQSLAMMILWYGINRFILCRGTNSGSAGSDAGFTGQTRQSGWHYYERSAVGDFMTVVLPDCWGESRRGWRTVFWVASVLMALMALALWRSSPQ